MKVRRDSSGHDDLRRAITDLQGASLRVGFFDTARYDDGTPVAYVATIQEFGSPSNGIPARPFMRPTVAEKNAEWKSILAAGARRVMDGKMTVEQMLGQVGAMAAGNISETIAGVTSPALADSTIAARESRRKTKGVSDKPLVDTGLMIQSVSYKVET